MIRDRRALWLLIGFPLLSIAAGVLPTLSFAPLAIGAVTSVVLICLAIVGADAELRSGLLLTVLVAAALLLPPLNGGGGGGTPVLFADVLFLGCAVAFILRGRTFPAGAVEIAFGLLAAVIALALIGSTITSREPTSIRDLAIFLRLTKYALVFVVSREIGVRLRDRWAQGWTLLLAPFLVMAAVGAMQYYSLFGVNSWLSSHYGGNAALLIEGVDSRRAFGTIGNSNYFGFLCAIGFILAIWVNLLPIPRRARIFAAFTAAVCAVSVFLSGSRAALISLAVMVLCVIALSVLEQRYWRRALVLILALVGSTPFLLSNVQGLPVARRYFFIWGSSDPASRLSFQLRKQLWHTTLQQLRGHWIFGLGPQKGVVVQWVDNDYLRVLREFGLVTAIPLIGLALVVVARFVKSLASRSSEVWSASVLGLATVLGLAAFSLAADTLYQDQVMSVLLVILGVVAAVGSSGEEDVTP